MDAKRKCAWCGGSKGSVGGTHCIICHRLLTTVLWTGPGFEEAMKLLKERGVRCLT